MDWESQDLNGTIIFKREFVVAVTIGDRGDNPKLETDKVSEARWFWLGRPRDPERNRPGTDTYVYDLIRSELS